MLMVLYQVANNTVIAEFEALCHVLPALSGSPPAPGHVLRRSAEAWSGWYGCKEHEWSFEQVLRDSNKKLHLISLVRVLADQSGVQGEGGQRHFDPTFTPRDSVRLLEDFVMGSHVEPCLGTDEEISAYQERVEVARGLIFGVCRFDI
jgi:hypothetical protein